MLTLLETRFLAVYYNEDINIFEAYWKKAERDINDEEFKSHLLAYVELFKDYSVKGIFIDSRESHIVMSIEIQEWHDEFIVPRYIEAKIEKIGFVMPQEYVTALSIEQAFDEQKAKALNVNYFADSIEAYEWLNS